MNDDIAIRLSSVSKKYNLYNRKIDRLKESLHPLKKRYHRDFYAVKDINLEIKKGEILGIVGRNGSGKSTLLQLVSGVLTPTSGTIEARGHIAALLELGSGFNPEYTGLENIYFYSALMGYKRDQIDIILQDILDFAELGDYINQPIKTYSSGMKARLAFAVSINVAPDILILDEVLAVGDELFRRKCYARMEEFFKGGKTILYVSHSANSINELCSRAVLIDRGEAIFDGPAKLVTALYHKYIYSSKEKVENMRKEIIALNLNSDYKNSVAEEIIKKGNNSDIKEDDFTGSPDVEKTPGPRAYFVENMKPKSTIEYKSHDVEILDVKLTTSSGEKVNMLVLNNKYIYSYVVKFNFTAHDVSFGMMFKNEKGMGLGGAVAPGNNAYIPLITKGSIYRIEWNFICNFLKGIYYANAGVRGRIGDEIVYLNRIVDSLVFKVQAEYNDVYTGQYFFHQSPVIVPIQNNEASN